MFNLFSFGVFCIGSILLLISLIMLARSLMLAFNGGQAEGMVTQLVEDSEDSLFAPVIQFNVNAQTYEFQHPSYRNPSPYKVGDKVQVLYNKTNPQKASINKVSSTYILPAILGLFGCLIVVGWLFVLNLK